MQYIFEQLVTDINEMNRRYYLVKSTGTDYDFYKEVMPYVEAVSYTHLTLPTSDLV